MIELRWLEQTVTVPTYLPDVVREDTVKVLQYREIRKMPIAKLYVGAPNMFEEIWSGWVDVPVENPLAQEYIDKNIKRGIEAEREGENDEV